MRFFLIIFIAAISLEASENCREISSVLGRARELRSEAQTNLRLRREFQTKMFGENGVFRDPRMMEWMSGERQRFLRLVERSPAFRYVGSGLLGGISRHVSEGGNYGPDLNVLKAAELVEYSPERFRVAEPTPEFRHHEHKLVPSEELGVLFFIQFLKDSFPPHFLKAAPDAETALVNLREMQSIARRLGIGLEEYRVLLARVGELFQVVDAGADTRHAFFQTVKENYPKVEKLKQIETELASYKEAQTPLLAKRGIFDFSSKKRTENFQKTVEEIEKRRQDVLKRLEFSAGVELDHEKMQPIQNANNEGPRTYQPKDRSELLEPPKSVYDDPIRANAIRAIKERQEIKAKYFDEGRLFSSKPALEAKELGLDILEHLNKIFSDSFLHGASSSAEALLAVSKLEEHIKELKLTEEEFSQFHTELKELNRDSKSRALVVELIPDWKNGFKQLSSIEAHLKEPAKELASVIPRIEAVSIKEIVDEMNRDAVSSHLDSHPITPYVAAVSEWTEAVVLYGSVNKKELFSEVIPVAAEIRQALTEEKNQSVSASQLGLRLAPLLREPFKVMEKKNADFNNLLREGMVIQKGLNRHLEREMQKTSSIETKISAKTEMSDLMEELLLHDYAEANSAIRSTTMLKTGIDALLVATKVNHANAVELKQALLQQMNFLQLLAVSGDKPLTAEQRTTLSQILDQYE